MAASGKIIKMEVDFSDTVDKKLPEYQELAQKGDVKQALEKLMALEKQTRLAADAQSTKRVLVAIVRLCFDVGDWTSLNEHIILLTKRRGQLKMAVQGMVEECCKYVHQTPGMEVKLKLIDTLRAATEGKIYVEVERARLTLDLAEIKEEQGDIAGAATILQDLQVDTYGSMQREEKVRFVLEQMRLCLAKKDFVRAQIVSKKISTKFFTESESDEVQELKLKFYNLTITLGHHDNDYLAICRDYMSIYQTPQVLSDEVKWKEALKKVVLYCILAPYGEEQSDLVHRIAKDKKLEQLPTYKEVLDCFTRVELLNWSNFQVSYGDVLRMGSSEEPATDVLQPNSDDGDKHWEELRKRIVEYNIRVVSEYYTRIRTDRLSELLHLPEQDVEDFVSRLVTSKTIFAKIDRPAGIVSFQQTKDPSEVLNEWSHSLNSLMTLVTKTTHLINKERMVHAV